MTARAMTLAPTQRGYAMALAAAALEVLEQVPRRLHWYVDLDFDPVIGRQYNSIDPSGDVQSHWGSLLQRFRTMLDSQGDWPDDPKHRATWDGRAEAALTIDHTLESSRRRVRTTFRLDWSVQLPLVSGRPPPAGLWVLWPQPPRNGWLREGDAIPQGEAWLDGMPF